MKKKELIIHLQKSIKKHTKIDVDESNFDTDLFDLGMDSIHAMEITSDLEELLDIIVDDRDIANFRSINQILEYFSKSYED